jgi:hypothetical protein
MGAEAMSPQAPQPEGDVLQQGAAPVATESIGELLPEGEGISPEDLVEGEESPEQQTDVLALAAEVFPDRQFGSEGEAVEAIREFTTAAKEFETKDCRARQEVAGHL